MRSDGRSEEEVLSTEEETRKIKKIENPYDKSNFFSKIFSLWILPFLWTGFRKTLKEEDIPQVPSIYNSRNVFLKYEHHFEKGKNSKQPLLASLIRFIWKEMLLLEVVNNLNIALSLASPFLQRIILEHIFPDKSTPEWVKWKGIGYIFVGILFFVQLVKVYLNKFSGELRNHIRFIVLNSLFAKVYNKLLHFSSKSLADVSNQSFVSYMTVEIGLVIVLPQSVMMLYKQPIMLVASIVLLFVNLSWPAFFVIVVVVVLIPIYLFLSIFLLLIFLPLLKLFNKNTKFITQVLKGIRVIKTNVWEDVFLERIMKRRKNFVRWVVCYFILCILFAMTYMLSPIIMQLVLFTITFTYEKENFTISKIFPSLTYVMLFSTAITALPALIIATGKGFLAVHRVQKLLKLEEFNKSFYSSPSSRSNNNNDDSTNEDDDDDNETKPTHEEEIKISENPSDYPIRMWNCSFKFFNKPEEGKSMEKVKKVIKKMKSLVCCCRKNKKDEPDINLDEQILRTGLLDQDEEQEEEEGEQDIELKQYNEQQDDSIVFSKEEVKSINEDEKKKKKSIGVLKNINLKIRKSSLVVIVGEVGSGKSMLLKSLVGELEKTNNGHLTVQGNISYCPQDAWVINETCEENILFGRDLEPERFQKVLEACDLEKDISVFPDGIKTEVGERGITLSGGQKQRIALARGFYYDADVYILDDISSSVDSGVANTIFKKGILGVIKNKTRLMVTNEISWLVKSDYIIALENGRIREEGRYDELMNVEDGFVKYLVHKFASVQENRIGGGSKSSLLKKEGIISKKEEEEEEEKESEVVIEIEEEDIDNHNDDDNNIEEKLKEEEKEEEKDKKKTSLMLKEEVKEGQVGCSTVWFYFQTFGCLDTSWSAVITLLFLTVATLFDFLYNQMIMIWLSCWTTHYLGIPDGAYLVVYASIGLTRPIVSIVRYFFLILFSLVSGVRITRKVFIRLMKTPISYWERTPLGRVMNRLSGDQFKTDFLIVPLESFIWAILELVFSFITVGLTNWFSLIIFACIIPVYLVIQEFYRRSSRQIRRIHAVSRSPMMALLQETIDGVHIIRTYHAEDHFFSRFCEKINYTCKVGFMSYQLNIWLNFILGSLSCVIIIISGLLIVGFSDFSSSYGIPVLAGLSFTHLLSLSERLSWAIREVVNIEQTFNSVERLSFYARELDIEKPAIIEDNRPPEDWALGNDFNIEVEDISMKYRDDLPLVLNKLSFKVKPREKVGVVGRTGCGKTSLFNVLFRVIEPCSGSIVIDGVEVTENFGLQDLRKIMSIIPQDPYLFKGTVRFNLDPAEVVKSDQELWNVLEKCRLKKTVEAYEDKLEHKIDGTNLSSGEKQLFCLARTLIRKAKILCLDEATANIDLETETYIRDTIDSEFKDCIVFTIAHRIHTIANSDRVLVIGEGGRIKEFDSPLDLSRNENSLFFEILSSLGKESKKKLIQIMEGVEVSRKKDEDMEEEVEKMNNNDEEDS